MHPRAVPSYRFFACVVCALVSTSACGGPTEPGNLSPLGHDTEVYGEWDVNHSVPSSEVCAVAGLTTIELAFFRLDDPTTEYTDVSLRWPCADGYYDSGTDRVLSAGHWQAEWRAYSGADVVARSVRYDITAIAGQEVVVHAVDWVRLAPIDLDIALRWATGSGFGTCADAFADTMTWELRVGSNTGAVEASSVGSATCANAIALHGYSHTTLATGLHTLVIHGSATDGASWSAECAVTVPEGGPASAICDVPRAP